MVFHYTNFVRENNEWWLRRVRPVYWGAIGVVLMIGAYRYFYYHKQLAVYSMNDDPEAETQIAATNKRSWGYNSRYKPRLEISLKARMKRELGENYKEAEKWENLCQDRLISTEDLYKEETENWEISLKARMKRELGENYKEAEKW